MSFEDKVIRALEVALEILQDERCAECLKTSDFNPGRAPPDHDHDCSQKKESD